MGALGVHLVEGSRPLDAAAVDPRADRRRGLDRHARPRRRRQSDPLAGHLRSRPHILVDFDFLRWRAGANDVWLATGIFVSIVNIFISLLNRFSSD